MRYSIGDLFPAVAIPVIAALGGAMIVYSEIDDAPGGVLLGLLLVAGAVVLGLRGKKRER